MNQNQTVPFEKLIQNLPLFNFNLWFLVKILILLGLVLYLAFAGIVLRQVNLMTKTLNGQFNLPIKLIAWIHLLAALSIFLLALIIL